MVISLGIMLFFCCNVYKMLMSYYTDLYVFPPWQSLTVEFEQHDTLLKELEKQLEEYRGEGKTEGATRLDQQIKILQVRNSLLVFLLSPARRGRGF